MRRTRRGPDTLVLLPLDPDASAARPRAHPRAHRSRGRRDRLRLVRPRVATGTTDVALGVAGIAALRRPRGPATRPATSCMTTEIAVADEIAGAAQLVMGKTDGIPAAIVRGLELEATAAAASSSCPASATCSGSASRSRLGPCASTPSGAPRPLPSTRRGCAPSASSSRPTTSPRRRHRRRRLRPQHVRPGGPEGVPASVARDVLGRVLRAPEAPDDALKASYPMLVRTLSNVVLLRVPGEGVWFTTMEQGTYHVSGGPRRSTSASSPSRPRGS